MHGCVGEPADLLADADVGSCRVIRVGSVFGVQCQPLFVGVRCVAIDIKGTG